MQIYTRTGDKGYTRIPGGAQVAKDSDRVKAYGTIDELNSIVGVVVSLNDNQRMADELLTIQQYLFDCGNDIATPYDPDNLRLKKDATLWLEDIIDYYTEKTPPIESFILPGGVLLSSFLHHARTVARRAEREIIAFQWQNDVNPETVRFVNRLSDFFFIAARYMNADKGYSDVLYERSGKVFHNEITKDDLPKM